MTLLAAGLDALVRRVPEAARGAGISRRRRAVGGAGAGCISRSLPLAVWPSRAASGIGGWSAAGAGPCAAGLWFGQVSNSNAHELIHRGDRRLFLLGEVGLCLAAVRPSHLGAPAGPSPLCRPARGPEHAAAGRKLLPLRPARLDRFVPRRAGAPKPRGGTGGGWHPYLHLSSLGAAGWLALACADRRRRRGWRRIWSLAAYAQMQLLLSDYVQHYGLARAARRTAGRRRWAPELSWNAPHWFTGAPDAERAAPFRPPRPSRPALSGAAPGRDRDRADAAAPRCRRWRRWRWCRRLWRRVMEPRLPAPRAHAGRLKPLLGQALAAGRQALARSGA